MGREKLIVYLLGCFTASLSEELEQCVDDGPLFQTKRHVVSQNHRPASLAEQTAIPPQLIMTGPFASMDDFPADVKANLEQTRKFSTGLKLRYFNDKACRDYLEAHFGDEFQQIFKDETHGAFRGDICRSAILLQEGGFYIDLDFELHVPMLSLVDAQTTFMTAYADRQISGKVVLNALIAVRPGSPVMKETMTRLRWWYSGPRKGLPGPVVMREAIEEMIKKGCPEVPSAGQDTAQWSCGTENVRLYQEEFFGIGQDCQREGQVVCPVERANSKFHGSGFGVFSIGHGTRESRLIGWPRYLACSQMGCGMGHHHVVAAPGVPQVPRLLPLSNQNLQDVMNQKRDEQQTTELQPSLAGPSAAASIPDAVQSSGSSSREDSTMEKLRRALEIERKEAWTSVHQHVQTLSASEPAVVQDQTKSSTEALADLKQQLEDDRNEAWDAWKSVAESDLEPSQDAL
jgi:hypothetical protein